MRYTGDYWSPTPQLIRAEKDVGPCLLFQPKLRTLKILPVSMYLNQPIIDKPQAYAVAVL